MYADEILDKRYTPEALAAMTPAAYLAELRRVCSKPGRGLKNHPFIEGIEAGTVTLPQLQFFAEQRYLHVRNMVPFFGQMACSCPHEDARAILIKNFAEEAFGAMTKTKGHPDHFLDFCAALGMDTKALQHKPQLGASRKLTVYYEFMAKCRPWYVPVAAIGAVMEASVPESFARLAAGFRKHYGLREDQIQFWTLHIGADKEHGDEGEDLVKRFVVTPEARSIVFECAIENAEIYWEHLSMYELVK